MRSLVDRGLTDHNRNRSILNPLIGLQLIDCVN